MSETGHDSAVLLKTQRLGMVLKLRVQTYDITTPLTTEKHQRANGASAMGWVFRGKEIYNSA